MDLTLKSFVAAPYRALSPLTPLDQPCLSGCKLMDLLLELGSELCGYPLMIQTQLQQRRQQQRQQQQWQQQQQQQQLLWTP